MPRFAPVALAAVLLVAARASPAKGETADEEQLYTCREGKGPVAVTLKPETEVKELVTWVMGFTCKRFVLDPRIVSTGKKVTVIAPREMAPDVAYGVFLSALATINLAVVPKGAVYRIVEARGATKETVPILRPSASPDGSDQVVRYVYRPAHAPIDTMKTAFTALKSESGELVALGGTLLITDYASHLRDMMTIAKQLDVPGGVEGVYTIPVQHADAKTIAGKLQELLGVGASAAATRTAAPPGAPPEAPAVPSKIVVDERTNTLVLASTEAGYVRIKRIVDRLDIALEVEGGATYHVYRLGSAIAEELAATLTQAIQGTGATTTAAKPSTTATGGAAPAPAPGKTTAPAGGTALEGPIRVIADKATNALIVMSSGRDFLALRQMIRELDQPRRQVFIEAMILEVAVGNGLEVGASSHGALPFGGTSLALGGVQTGTISSLNPTSLAGVGGAIGGLLGAPLAASKFYGTSIPSYGLLFQALADTSALNIMSAPSLIALDNEETKYKVGTNIPYQKGVIFTGVTGGESLPNAAQTNYDRRDLTLQLTIKPHISANDDLLLEVGHEAEDLLSEGGPGGPVWSTRALTTRVVARDQQTVVIGGLLQERMTSSSTKVPILGDLPLLGYLFKRTIRSKKKTNLVILLTPYIVRDQLEAQAIRERKLREYEEFTSGQRALSAMQYMPRVDYRKKRGLIEEINRTVLEVEADTAARAALRTAPVVVPGPIEAAP